MRTEQGLELVLLLVTDVVRKGSHVWAVGERLDVAGGALGLRLEGGTGYLDGCMSRKKQAVPPLERAFAELR